MKNMWKLYILFFALTIGITSCEDQEDFEKCPEINVDIDNVPGSLVYRFVAQIEGIEDVELIWSVDGEEINSGNLDDISGQILDYQFDPGKHNICVKVADENCPIEVCKEIEVIGDDNNPCPDLFFETVKQDNVSSYKFIADFKGVDSLNYVWFVNGELVPDSISGNNNTLYWDFDEAGKYEVCIKAETPDCPEGTSYCREVVVKENNGTCPKVFFRKETEPGATGVYNFEAILNGNTEGAEVNWFINEERVEHPTNPQEGARILMYQFEPGTFEVCLKVSTPDCPDGVMFCKDIKVTEKSCPEPFFSRDGNYLYADFEGRDDLKWYGWFVNGEIADDEYLKRNRDNKFSLENLEAGTYEICIQYETSECPDFPNNKFCKEIIIDKNESCPKLSFDIEIKGDATYSFYPSAFDGIDGTTLEWYANDTLIGTSADNPSNKPFTYQFTPGKYDICLRVETPECPNGTEFCETINVKDPGNCLNLKFSREGDYLKANFQGIDTLRWYGWEVNGELVEDENLDKGRDNKFSLKDLKKGTYKICIFTETPECPGGTRFCQKITIE